MKTLLCLVAATVALATPAWAHAHDHAHAHDTPEHAHTHAAVSTTAAPLDAHTLQDIERHRGMANAHAQAAQCLEHGKPYADCQKQLQASCKGLALGKHCGMRHSH